MHLRDTIRAFYTERGVEFSGEQDMGVWHWDDIQIFDYPRRISLDRQPGAVEIADEPYLAFTAESSDRMRVSIVAETGDVYALRLKTGEVALLGNVDITDPERGLSNSRERSPVYIQTDTLIGDYAQESAPLGRPLSWFVERLDV
ncbi:MAG: hypothetical protein OXD31_01715 [Chloroflexi bacterium]|nr:hypothetical protein [Chloroflexota bacterium]